MRSLDNELAVMGEDDDMDIGTAGCPVRWDVAAVAAVEVESVG